MTCLVADWMVPVVCEPIDRKRRPATPWHGRVSLPYTVAEALHFGRLDAGSYRPENLQAPDLLQLVDHIEYQIDDRAKPGRNYKGWIRAMTHSGKSYEHIKLDEEDSDRSMSDDRFFEKIRGCILLASDDNRFEAIRDAVDNLDKAGSVHQLMKACFAGRSSVNDPDSIGR